MRVHYRTYGCKTNQYDTERMREALESLGLAGSRVPALEDADLCVVNTCTVTNQADADARRFVRRARRENPDVRIVVAGCSAALHAGMYESLPGVVAVVEGHDPAAVVEGARQVFAAAPARLVQLGSDRPLDRVDWESVGATVLTRRAGGTRGWLKVQDGCDRKCAFCATRLARGPSRSRRPEEILREAQALAQHHPELVITGVHIGHYGRDLDGETTLSTLVRRLVEGVPEVRFRLGSIEATEVDDALLDLLADSGGALAPHLHMPLQSGADPVLRRMRRWHTREMYRARTVEIASRTGPLGLGADVICGFPGETDQDHEQTRRLIDELPFTYLHVFPFSVRDDTVAATLPDQVSPEVARERAAELRALAERKGRAYARSRGGQRVQVVLEGDKGSALTEDYLRVQTLGPVGLPGVLKHGVLDDTGSHVRIDLTPADGLN